MTSERRPIHAAQAPAPRDTPPSVVGLAAADASLPAGHMLERVARGTRDLDPETTAAGEFLAAL